MKVILAVMCTTYYVNHLGIDFVSLSSIFTASGTREQTFWDLIFSIFVVWGPTNNRIDSEYNFNQSTPLATVWPVLSHFA